MYLFCCMTKNIPLDFKLEKQRGLPVLHILLLDTRFLFPITLTTIYLAIIIYCSESRLLPKFLSWFLWLLSVWPHKLLNLSMSLVSLGMFRTYSKGFIYYFPFYFWLIFYPRHSQVFRKLEILCYIVYESYGLHPFWWVKYYKNVNRDPTWTHWRES